MPKGNPEGYLPKTTGVGGSPLQTKGAQLNTGGPQIPAGNQLADMGLEVPPINSGPVAPPAGLAPNGGEPPLGPTEVIPSDQLSPVPLESEPVTGPLPQEGASPPVSPQTQQLLQEINAGNPEALMFLDKVMTAISDQAAGGGAPPPVEEDILSQVV